METPFGIKVVESEDIPEGTILAVPAAIEWAVAEVSGAAVLWPRWRDTGGWLTTAELGRSVVKIEGIGTQG